MNLLPESNVIYKTKKGEKITPQKWFKNFFSVIAFIIIAGILFQLISNFIGKEKTESSLYYAKIDGKRIEYLYNANSTSEYTIVFDGAVGTNLYQFDDLCKELKSKLGVQTFVYNRNGYGFSDVSDIKSPETQAKELKTLLKKAGVTGKVIFVGEEYGSLIATNYAKLYSESVYGVLLINPISKKELESKEFKENLKPKYIQSNIDYYGSYCGLTTLLTKMGKSFSVNEFEANLDEREQEEFNILKTKKAYRKAVKNELTNLYKGTDTAQEDGLLINKPLYIISKSKNDPLISLGSKELTYIYKTSNDKLTSATDKDSVISGIEYLVKEAKKIERKNSNQ